MDETPVIGANHVVSLAYTVRDDDGEILDASEDAEPLVYLHGHDQVFPALELALVGKAVGALEQILVSEEEGYGARDPEKILTVPRDRFDFTPEAGQILEARTDEGQALAFQVVSVDDRGVTLDGNHPLAGKRLHFEVKVVAVRPATAEELEHGHAHDAGRCDDHDHGGCHEPSCCGCHDDDEPSA
jgi:FKBP-type peptidyl-prolyl cis-trans isomerase SlyD